MAVVYVNIPAFFFFSCIYIANMIRNKVMHGFYWSRELSIFFKDDDNSLDYENVLGVILMSFTKFFAFYFVVLTFG